jgi:hypothetical protein
LWYSVLKTCKYNLFQVLLSDLKYAFKHVYCIDKIVEIKTFKKFISIK